MTDERCPYQLWVDLETTGLSLRDDVILEVGAILTEFRAGSFVELDRFDTVIARAPRPNAQLRMIDVVREMHEASGLLADLEEAHVRLHTEAAWDPDRGDFSYVSSLDQADHMIANMIAHHVGLRWRSKIQMAGSGVSHFDLERVRTYMPATMDWLSWRPLDVGQLEEWWRLVGLNTFHDAFPDEAKRLKTHRAMSDLEYHMREAEYVLQDLQFLRRSL